ncbi:MAG: type I restriction endonuclease subunit R [Acidobacteria bacterium]|nr:type I restriction endonuclease subunit R [Acidobacteriota bacterium]
MMPGGYSEDALIERPAIALFEELDWKAANCFYEKCGGDSATLGRTTTQEVVLVPKLRSSLQKLNPDLPSGTIDLAVEQLTQDRSALNPVVANREVYRLLKDGVHVTITDENGAQETETVRVIDWDNAGNNDFFLASQFWIAGEIYKRRVDLLGFVNGLPLIFVELKAVHKNLKNAFDKNLCDYKSTIPQLFWYNAFIILSNGSESKVGTMTAPWEHFSEWKKISSEEEPGIVSLETAIRGTCEKTRFIDILENFILFTTEFGPLVKILAKYHQFLGVNNSIRALAQIKQNQGKLGVFWHTQGSGKTYAMMFFSQKVLRKIPGRWTFVIVTDRDDLDTQIYEKFANASLVIEPDVHATSSAHLRQLLSEDHRHVFTIIHKFRTERGQRHPVISARSDVIIMTDEAHRTQYDILAKNMRDALPKAAFLAFTGTPLIVGEEKTRDVFGDYVSIYDFKQSLDDRSTVPLYYENRIPELQLTNKDFNGEMEALLENAELDEEQEKKLEREFSRQYHLITRDDRLETIAEDIVAHFMGRGYRDKAMVVSVDKATAVRMYDKVRKHWQQHLANLRKQLVTTSEGPQREELEEKIKYMAETDMAVVISQSQNEIEEMKKKGLDILPHRQRMVKQDLDRKFKNADDPFRIVFVCAMWMTGFDVPCCSTIYLDKPMRNHTLMQTIARANRVFRDKVNGLIVDYVGVFRNLQKALAIYGSGHGGTIGGGETPVLSKDRLVELLRAAIERVEAFCSDHGVNADKIREAVKFERVRLIKDAAEAIMVNDQTKRQFLFMVSDAVRLFRAILPDPRGNEFLERRNVVAVIAERIKSLAPQADISGVMDDVEKLLDRSVAAEAYVIGHQSGEEKEERYVDLSQIDFEALKERFAVSRKRTETERLRSLVEQTLEKMLRMNRTRVDFRDRLQKMLDEYNSGAINVEIFFKQLLEFAKELNVEEKRAISESLTEEELAIFDLLTKPEMDLTQKERGQLKKVAKDLLGTLKSEKLILDWRKRQQSRAQVLVAIQDVLDKGLPEKFGPELFNGKCELIYQHVYDSYPGEGRGVYAAM